MNKKRNQTTFAGVIGTLLLASVVQVNGADDGNNPNIKQYLSDHTEGWMIKTDMDTDQITVGVFRRSDSFELDKLCEQAQKDDQQIDVVINLGVNKESKC